MRSQSKQKIAQAVEGGKPEEWRSRMPDCDAVRPACCPSCGAPSRPPGGGVGLHGHGTRARSQRGPTAPGEAPQDGTIGARRYRCKACGQTMTVVPRGVVRRRLYPATAIGLALALFGLSQLSAAAVRGEVAPTASVRDAAEAAPWSTLGRWAHEAKAGTLLESGRPCPESFTLRQAAERLAVTLEALGPRGPDRLGRVWQGALEAHWRGAS